MRPSPCLLQLVSWLLVAFIPGLLMLATFGLSRLEEGLGETEGLGDDVTAMLEQAKADSLRKPIPVRVASAPELLPLRETCPDWHGGPELAATLPTRVYVHHPANPRFRETRQADRV